MQKSIFEILGPVMIGPSSSHTAGAARIGRIAREIAGGKFDKAHCLLHGSFASTYKGHGTDIAIAAGLMGIKEDDENLKNSFSIAEQNNKTITFDTVELFDVHENTVKIIFDDNKHYVIGSSIGGGSVVITEYDGFKINISGNFPTFIITQYDKSGVISEVSSVFADKNINIATMNVSRKIKGDLACMVIECDGEIPDITIPEILKLKDIINAVFIKKLY